MKYTHLQTASLASLILVSLIFGACGTAEPLNSGQAAPATPTEPAIPSAEATPTALQPDVEATVTCDFGILDAIEQFDTIDQLSWFSHQVVVATVVDQLESRTVPGGPTPEVPYYIVTDYVLRVEERIRGGVVDGGQTLTIRSWGGTVDACTQRWEGWPPFEIGDRALFFLRDFEDETSRIYDIFGRHQGYWEIDKNGRAAPPGATHLLPEGQSIELKQLTDMVRDSLMTGPPTDTPTDNYYVQRYLVPLEDAPLVGDSGGPLSGKATPTP